jgi:hypothetical protein
MSAAASLRRPDREHDQEEVMTGFTRRKMLTGVAATASGCRGLGEPHDADRRADHRRR